MPTPSRSIWPLAAAWLCALVLLAAAAPASADEHVAPLQGLHNDDGRLVDELGRTVVLRGINVVDKSGWSGELADPILTQEDAELLADMGFNHVRLGTTWGSLEHERDVFDQDYVDQFITVLDDLYAAGLLAVVDMHQDVWGGQLGGNGAPDWADPQCNEGVQLPLAGLSGTWFAQYGSPDGNVAWANFWADGYGDADLHCTGAVQTEFVEMWRWFAGQLAGHPAVVGYDVLNEPWPSAPPGVFEAAQLSPMYARVGQAIRDVDAATPIYFEPALYSPAVPTVGLTPPDPNSVFAPHIYTETMFSGGAVSTDATTDEVALIKDLDDGARMGVPVWIGEWGEVIDDDYTRQFYDMLDRHQIGSAFWRYRQRPGETPRTDGHEAPHVRIYPEAWPGEARWSYDPTTGAFAMEVSPPAGQHEVRIVAPNRLDVAAPAGTVHDPVSQRLRWCVEGPGTSRITLGPQTTNSSTCEVASASSQGVLSALATDTTALPATGGAAAALSLVAVGAGMALRSRRG